MTDVRAERFRALGPDELEDWAAARAAEAGLAVPDAHLAAVIENLAVIQGHSRRLAMALRDAADEGDLT